MSREQNVATQQSMGEIINAHAFDRLGEAQGAGTASPSYGVGAHSRHRPTG